MATIYYKQNREWKKIQGLGGGGGSGATINRTALYNLLLAGDGINIINTDDIINKVLIEVNGDWKPTYSDSFLVGSEGSENVKIYVDGKLSYANPVKNFTYKLPITSGTSGKTYELLATSNVKTFFGSQSIVGTGSVDLHRHLLTAVDSETKYLVTIPVFTPFADTLTTELVLGLVKARDTLIGCPAVKTDISSGETSFAMIITQVITSGSNVPSGHFGITTVGSKSPTLYIRIEKDVNTILES